MVDPRTRPHRPASGDEAPGRGSKTVGTASNLRRDSPAGPPPWWLSRRTLLAATGLVLGARQARAAAGPLVQTETLVVDGFPVRVERYVAAGPAKRPTVLLLHGSKGLNANRPAYEGYARAIAAAGIDALLFSYFEADDAAAITAAQDASDRRARYSRAIDRWVSLVRGIATWSQRDALSSGRVGLLGFSLGGFVAVASASRPLFSVLAVFYAGLPTFYDHPITFFPPLLDLHGDADRAIPLHEGASLVAAAKRLGGVAELATFPHEGHGFDLESGNPDAPAARRRAIAFLARWLA